MHKRTLRSIAMYRAPLIILVAIAFLFTSCQRTETVEQEAFGMLEKFEVDPETKQKNGAFEKSELDGTLYEKATYSDDKLHGVRTIYFPNGTPEVIENYNAGILSGEYKTFFDNASIEILGTYTDGVMKGIWKKHYKSGQIMEEVTFAENMENGPFVEYHENGNLKAEGQYLNGNFEEGLLKLYDENGEIYRRMECNIGMCNTVWLRPGYEETDND